MAEALFLDQVTHFGTTVTLAVTMTVTLPYSILEGSHYGTFGKKHEHSRALIGCGGCEESTHCVLAVAAPAS